MKQLRIKILVGIVALAAVAAAIAGQVYDRATATLTTTGGTSIWTNTYKYAAIELKNIWIRKCLIAVDTVTVSRVTSDNAYTQTVGTITTAVSNGNTTSFTASYMAEGDMLRFSADPATGSTAMIEFEVQKH